MSQIISNSMNIEKKILSTWSYSKKVLSKITYPKNINELKEAIIYAKENNLKVIPMGNGNSYGDLFINNDGLVVSNNKLNKIINIDEKKNIITVEAGVKLSDLNIFVLKKKMKMFSLPSYLNITVGGAISNNVHGQDSGHYNEEMFEIGYFNDQVLGLKYIDANANIKYLNREKNKDEFENFIGSVGLLGFITEIEIKLTKLNSYYLIKNYTYFNTIESFFKHTNTNDIKKFAFADIKVNVYSNNNETILETSNWNYGETKKIVNIDDFKKKILNIFRFSITLPYNLYDYIKKIIYYSSSFVCSRIFWKIANFLFFRISRYKKPQTRDVINHYYVDKFSSHNRIFLFKKFHGLQVLIPIENYQSVIIEFFNILKKNNNESFLCQIKYLAKRNDFIYDIGKHVSLSIPFIIDNKNKELVEKIINLIIEKKCQLNLSKDNLQFKKDDFYKIFPKAKKFNDLKKIMDPNCLFSSSYYERMFRK